MTAGPTPRPADPDAERVRLLELELREARREAKEQRLARERREAEQAAAESAIVALKAGATKELDAVLGEVRRVLPGFEALAVRVIEALRRFERESQPYRARAGVARESAHRADRLLADHAIGPLLPWLALLRAPATGPVDPAVERSPGVADAE